MKVANKESIETGEKELLDTIIAELDWEVIEKKLKEKHNIRLQEDVEFNNGDIVVHGNKIAYKLNFDVKITLAVIFDRLGECLSISAAGSEDDIDEAADEDSEEELTPPELPLNEENNKMAEDLSGMIDEINNDEE
eukprot:gnl/Chilomastix_cuspidata/9392.p2 GENE.gnl/Chilomastix_cuspidata/9392~~gnl/Chilomastix_cuspidata/9392.p2  ORF type:complete len:136 (+),score=22.31 gnl/Chilomastix_cuspidata/9392:254-661(+)